MLEHAHTYTATVVKPTCDTPGYTTYVCKACGDSYTEPTSAQGHKYAAAVVEPTCTADGYTLYACTDCDNSYRDKVIPAFGHAYDDDFDADCNNCGEVREVACPHAYKNPEAPVCAFCGEMLSLSDMLTVYGVSDNAQLTRGDTFTLTVMIKNNPGLVGWRVYVGFDESVLELVNQTGDAKWSNTTFGPQKSPANVMFADAIHPDVEGDGTMFTLTFRVREDAAFGTSLLDVYVKDSMDFYDRAWGEFEISTVDTAVVVSDHTHTYDGVCDGACNICGFTRDAEEHTYDNACDAACNGCGLVRKVEPHPYTSQVTAPTCTADGFTVYTCSICGDRYVDDIVPAPGHNHKGKVTTEPTCEGEGVMTYVCTACGDTYTQSIPALGHDYTVTVFDPDCVNDGYTLHSCNRCRYSYTDEIVPALGHKAGAPADCENAQTCTVCGVELTPALGHDYDAVVTAPTCTTDGYTTHTCANCGDTYVDSVVTALGHKYDNACDPTCNTCGESREVGDHVYDHDYDAICNECGYEREIPYIPGDVNDDGKVNVRDQGLLQQHLNGWEVTINLAAADVNRDGKVNVRDQGLLQQYLNGWDVTLK